MGRGRKRVATKIKQQRGTARADRVLENEVEYAVLDEIPPPPEILNKDGGDLWIMFCEQAKAIGLLSSLAYPQILDYCLQYQIYLHSARKVAKSRTPGYDNKSNYLQKNYRLMVQARNQMKVFESEWGLTPASAAKVPAPTQGEKKKGSRFDL